MCISTVEGGDGLEMGTSVDVTELEVTYVRTYAHSSIDERREPESPNSQYTNRTAFKNVFGCLVGLSCDDMLRESQAKSE
jgi:hypothetical protein